MAITIVGTAMGTAKNGSDISITLPTVLVNDIIVICGGHFRESADAGTDTSGYTELIDENHSAGDYRFSVSYKRMGATPDTTVNGLGSGDAADACAYAVIAYRGVDTTTAIDATTTTAQGQSTNPDCPSITTATNGAIVIACVGSEVSDPSGITAPTNYTNLIADNGNDTNDSTVAQSSRIIASLGAEDPAEYTGFSTGDWIAASVALRPAPVTGRIIGRLAGIGGGLVNFGGLAGHKGGLAG